MSEQHRTPNWKDALIAIVLAVLLLAIAGRFVLGPSPVAAQNNGQTGTLTTYVKVFSAQTTLGRSTKIIPNIGAASHWLTYCPNINATAVQIELDASNDGVTWFPISHVGTQLYPGCFVLAASGYFQNLSVNLITLSGAGTQAIDASYTGSTGPIPGNFPSDSTSVQGQSIGGIYYPNVQVSTATSQPATNTATATGAAIDLQYNLVGFSKTSPAFYNISAVCSAGTATLNVCNEITNCTAAVVYSLPVGTTPLVLPFGGGPLIGLENSVTTIELTSCGGGNVGRLNVVSGRVWTSP